jgi:hypothetical protein
MQGYEVSKTPRIKDYEDDGDDDDNNNNNTSVNAVSQKVFYCLICQDVLF